MGWLIAYILTAVGVAGGLFYPVLGVFMFHALSILKPHSLWFYYWSGASVPRFAFYVSVTTLGGWLFRGGGNWAALRNARWPMMGYALFILSGLFASMNAAKSPTVAWQFWDMNFKIGVMSLVTLLLLRTKDQIMGLCWVVAVATGFLALSLNQFYLRSPVFVYGYYLAGLDNNGWAMIHTMSAPVCFFMGLYARNLWVKLGCFGATLMVVHVVLFSQSRGGQLGLIAVAGMIFAFAFTVLPRKGLTIGMAVVSLAAGLYLAGPQVRERFATIFVNAENRDASANARLQAWTAALRCIQANPLGVGPRNFELVAENYGLDRQGKTVHNTYLQVAADYGILGSLGWTMFYVGTIVKVTLMTIGRAARVMVWPKLVGGMVATSLTGFLLCALFLSIESIDTSYLIAMIGLATDAHVSAVSGAIEATDPSRLPELAQVDRPANPEDEFEEEKPDLLPGAV